MSIGGRRIGIILLLAACAGVTSCGGNDSAAYDYGQACGLMTDDEAERVLGVPVHDGEADHDRTVSASYCEWISRGSSTSDGEAAYSVFVAEESGRAALEKFEDVRQDGGAREVRGIGDEAYTYPPGSDSLRHLTVRVDDHVAVIGVGGDADHPVTERGAVRRARTAAEFVAPRL